MRMIRGRGRVPNVPNEEIQQIPEEIQPMPTAARIEVRTLQISGSNMDLPIIPLLPSIEEKEKIDFSMIKDHKEETVKKRNQFFQLVNKPNTKKKKEE